MKGKKEKEMISTMQYSFSFHFTLSIFSPFYLLFLCSSYFHASALSPYPCPLPVPCYSRLNAGLNTLTCISHLDFHPPYSILPYPILPYPILSYFILSYPILSYPILSYPILSYPILSYPILSYPILSYPILSNPILFHPIQSYHLT